MVVIKASSEYVRNTMGNEAYDKIEEFSKVIGYEYEFGEEVRIEFNPDRPDLFSFVTLAIPNLFFLLALFPDFSPQTHQ